MVQLRPEIEPHKHGISIGKRTQRVPIALIYLGSILRKAGYNVKIFHMHGEEEEAYQQIIKLSPLFVGISVIIGEWLAVSERFSAKIKNAIDTKIVWGGKSVAVDPKQFIESPYIDYLCLEDGEETIVELAATIEGKSEIGKVKGIMYKEGDTIISTEKRPVVTNLDKFEYDWGIIEDWNKYLYTYENKLILHDVMMTKRKECPFRCGFCYMSRYGKVPKQTHSVEYVLAKLKELKKITNVDAISFADDEFWIDSNRAFQIVEGMKKLGISLATCRLRITDIKDEKMVQRMVDLGIKRIGFGLESGVDRILKMMKKGFTTTQVMEKIKLLSKFPLDVGASLIIGSPTETKEEIIQSIRFAQSLIKINPNFMHGVTLYKPYPGTVFYQKAVDLGYHPPKSIKDWTPMTKEKANTIANQWLPWFNKKEEYNYNMLRQYIPLSASLPHTNNKIRFILKKILRYITIKRLHHYYFAFPIEMYVWRNLYPRLLKLFKKSPQMIFKRTNERETVKKTK